MEIHRPQARALTAAEEAAMDTFRQRVHQLALRGGLSVQNVRNMVQAMKAHPEFSADILKVLFDELHALQEQAPGHQPFELD